jgi:hypothetical protein
MRFEWIHQRIKEFKVSIMCKVLQVSRSGYYAWVDRPPSAGAARQAELTQAIVQMHQGLAAPMAARAFRWSWPNRESKSASTPWPS